MISSIRKAISDSISSFEKAKKTKQLPFWIITANAIYIPFEDYITNLIPISSVRSLARFAPEIFLYGVAFLVLYHKFRFGGGLRKTPMDPLLIMVFLAANISIFANGASPAGSFDNFRTNWRYVSIYYTLVNINIDQAQLVNLLKILKTAGLIQAVVSSIQFFLPTAINVKVSSSACRGIIEGKGANCGTFGDNAILAGFLLVIFTIFLSSYYVNPQHLLPTNKQDLINLLLFYFALFSSKKRTALMMGFIIPMIIFSILKKRMWIIKSIWGAAFAIFIAVVALSFIPSNPDPLATAAAAQEEDLSSFGSLLSAEYWQNNAESSRLWMMIVIVSSLLKSGQIWFGFGPELGIVPQGIEPFLTDPEKVAQLHRNLFVFDDPYWFAVLAYFGLVGLILYWWVILRLYNLSNKIIKSAPTSEDKIIAMALRTIAVIAFLYSFAERLFVLRSFSFYFWLLAGIVNNRYINKFSKPDPKKEVPAVLGIWRKRKIG